MADTFVPPLSVGHLAVSVNLESGTHMTGSSDGLPMPTPEVLLPPHLSPDESSAILRTFLGLTPSEARVALLLAEGFALRDIAVRLGRSLSTVRGNVETSCIRLGIRSRRLSSLVACLLWWAALESRPGGRQARAVRPGPFDPGR